MEYTIWNRINREEEDVTKEAAQEIMAPALYDTGPYGYMGTKIDKVLYVEAEGEDLPTIAAVRYAGEWYLIPKNQTPFMEHELANHDYENEE